MQQEQRKLTYGALSKEDVCLHIACLLWLLPDFMTIQKWCDKKWSTCATGCAQDGWRFAGTLTSRILSSISLSLRLLSADWTTSSLRCSSRSGLSLATTTPVVHIPHLTQQSYLVNMLSVQSIQDAIYKSSACMWGTNAKAACAGSSQCLCILDDSAFQARHTDRHKHSVSRKEKHVPSIWSLSPAGVIMKFSRVTLTETSGR